MSPSPLVLVFIVGIAATALAESAESDARLSGDATRGEEVYRRCAACHSMDRNRTGPMHCHLLGRRAGSVEDFRYSAAMAKSGIIWDRETLNWFLEAPLRKLPGTTMGYTGIKDPQERADLIEFLSKRGSDPASCPG